MTKSRGQENLDRSCEATHSRNLQAEMRLQFLRSSQLENNRFLFANRKSFPKPRRPTRL
jgi:hypothetical protein